MSDKVGCGEKRRRREIGTFRTFNGKKNKKSNGHFHLLLLLVAAETPRSQLSAGVPQCGNRSPPSSSRLFSSFSSFLSRKTKYPIEWSKIVKVSERKYFACNVQDCHNSSIWIKREGLNQHLQKSHQDLVRLFPFFYKIGLPLPCLPDPGTLSAPPGFCHAL